MFDLTVDMAAARKPTNSKQAQIVLRVDAELLELIQAGHRVQTMASKLEGDDAPDLSRSLRRWLRIGLEATLGKAGPPKSEEEWKALERSMLEKKTH